MNTSFQTLKRYLPWMIVVGITLSYAPYLYAAESEAQTFSWFFLCISMFGGLALFLYGMEKMSTGLKRTAGNRMRAILAALTRNRVIAMFVGAFITMVIQSSSATTVMLVSFVQAGLMTFVQSMGVILGADIGTTVTAQLIAFKLTDYALLMIAIGFSLHMFGKKEIDQKCRRRDSGIRYSLFRHETHERRHATPENLCRVHRHHEGNGESFSRDFDRRPVYVSGPEQQCHHRCRHCPGTAGAPDPRGRYSTGVRCQYRHLHHGRAGLHRHLA